MESVISGRDAEKAVINDHEHIHLILAQKNLTGYVYRANRNNVFCSDVILSSLKYLEYFPSFPEALFT